MKNYENIKELQNKKTRGFEISSKTKNQNQTCSHYNNFAAKLIAKLN